MQIQLIPQFQVSDFSKLIIKKRPNHAVGVPSFWEDLTKSDEAKGKDLSFLKSATAGGDRLNTETERIVNAFFKEHNCSIKITKGYGLTESASSSTFTINEACNKPGSVGIPIWGLTVKIINPSTQTELSYHEEGEICISGDTVMQGYYHNAEATKDVLKRHSDGLTWLHTGDLGSIDKDGVLYIRGRIKRVIFGRNGHTIYPSLAEDVLQLHPSVDTCAFVGVRDRNFQNGTIPTAFVVLKNHIAKSKALKKELDVFCNSKLPSCDCPYEYQFVEELPLTPIGKVDYRKLENGVDNTY